MSYAAGIGSNTSVWPSGAAPLPRQTGSRRGRPQTRLQRDAEHQPISVKALALSLPAEAWQTIRWREGCADWLA
jgi:SRSO17 transposase